MAFEVDSDRRCAGAGAFDMPRRLWYDFNVILLGFGRTKQSVDAGQFAKSVNGVKVVGASQPQSRGTPEKTASADKAQGAIVMSCFAKNIVAALAVSVVLLPAVGHAQSKNQGYLLDMNSNIVTSTNTGLCWRTSDWTPARAVAQCDPDLVKKPAAEPARKEATPPAPAVVTPPKKVEAAPVKPAPKKITFAADALFDFDKSVLKPQGKAMLDELATTLQGATYEVILAIGHTDRIGSVKYNQKLSVKRAEAVKEYLIGKNIAANRIYAEGKGKSQPVTKPGDCKGKLSKALIACLQPDRRVAVEVTGSK